MFSIIFLLFFFSVDVHIDVFGYHIDSSRELDIVSFCIKGIETDEQYKLCDDGVIIKVTIKY